MVEPSIDGFEAKFLLKAPASDLFRRPGGSQFFRQNCCQCRCPFANTATVLSAFLIGGFCFLSFILVPGGIASDFPGDRGYIPFYTLGNGPQGQAGRPQRFYTGPFEYGKMLIAHDSTTCRG